MLKSVVPDRPTFDADPIDALVGAGGVLWAAQGKMHVRRGDLFGALQSFERALECDMGCVEAWTGLSDLFEGIQDRRRAEACLKVARRIRNVSARERSA